MKKDFMHGIREGEKIRSGCRSSKGSRISGIRQNREKTRKGETGWSERQINI